MRAPFAPLKTLGQGNPTIFHIARTDFRAYAGVKQPGVLMKTAPILSLWITAVALSSLARGQSIHATPDSVWSYGVKATQRYTSSTINTVAPSVFISYSLIPQRLGLHSSVRLGTGWDARGVGMDVQLRSQFIVAEQTHLGLTASTSWLNSSASQERMGAITGQMNGHTGGAIGGYTGGGNAGYALAMPSSGLRDIRGGFTLTGPLYERWSYSTGASVGRFLGDSRTAAMRYGGNGTVGLVFFRADYTF